MDHASGISTEYYKVFYYVGRLGSITAAAEALCISPACGESGDQAAGKSAEHKAFSSDPEGVSAHHRGKASVSICGARDGKPHGR